MACFPPVRCFLLITLAVPCAIAFSAIPAALKNRNLHVRRPSTESTLLTAVSAPGDGSGAGASASQPHANRACVRSHVLDEWVTAAWKDRDGHKCADPDETGLEAAMKLRGKISEEEWIARERKAWLNNEGAKTYGEITVNGFRGVARRLDLRHDDVFVDLGSGVGKTVTQAFLEFGVRRSVGVELDGGRHTAATLAVADVEEYQKYCEQTRDVSPKSALQADNDSDISHFYGGDLTLIKGDIFKTDLSEATIIWCCNVCFSPDMDSQVAEYVSKHPTIRGVACLKDFVGGVPGFQYAGEEKFEMSWSPESAQMGLGFGTSVHFYTR